MFLQKKFGDDHRQAHKHPGPAPAGRCPSCCAGLQGEEAGAGPGVVVGPPHPTVQAELSARRSQQEDNWGQQVC